MAKPTYKELIQEFYNLTKTSYLEQVKNRTLSEHQDKFGNLIKAIDYDTGIIIQYYLDEDSNGNPVMAESTYNFYTSKEKQIKELGTQICQILYSEAQETTRLGQNHIPFLKLVQEELAHLTKTGIENSVWEIITQEIQTITAYLETTFNIKPLERRRTTAIHSYFGINDNVLGPMLGELYDIAERFDIIDVEEVEESDFIEVLSGNPDNPTTSIKFKCPNAKAIFFLELIKPYYSNLNPKQIETSQRIFTKGGTILTVTNYHRSKTSIADLPEQFKTDLTEEITEIFSS